MHRGVLRPLEASDREQHCFLDAHDRCHYLWDYRPGRPRTRQQQWIANLKCPPSLAQAVPLRAIYKERAIRQVAQALRGAVPRAWAEQASWVPIPPSICQGDAGYDDRLLRVLRAAFAGYDTDIRPLLAQTHSIRPDHRRLQRSSFEELFALLHLQTAQLAAQPLRGHLVLFDDVLTTGKHFKCAQARVREALGPIAISACFLARRVLAAPRRGEPQRV